MGVFPANQHPPEPTSDQCDTNSRMPDFEGRSAYACWYPQMGGYHGKSVVVVERREGCNVCFEVFIWHDGCFPFVGEDGVNPVCIHHCEAEQFIQFGRLVQKLQREAVL